MSPPRLYPKNPIAQRITKMIAIVYSKFPITFDFKWLIIIAFIDYFVLKKLTNAVPSSSISLLNSALNSSHCSLLSAL